MTTKYHWIHGKAEELLNLSQGPFLNQGPFVRLSDGHLLTVRDNCACVSPDDGKTWTHHRIFADGRLWMLLRTNWGRFWETFSDDEGRTWKGFKPTRIDASSTPGFLYMTEIIPPPSKPPSPRAQPPAHAKSNLLSVMFGLACLIATAAATAIADTAVFVDAGEPALIARGVKDWKRGKDYLEASGTRMELWAGKGLGKGDFHVTAKLTIHKLAQSGAAFRIGSCNYFGFEGSHGKVFLTGPLFEASGTPIGEPSDFITDGKPFRFEVVRKGKELTFLIDGKLVHKRAFGEDPVGAIGFIPWRATMQIHNFSAEGTFVKPQLPQALSEDPGLTALSKAVEAVRAGKPLVIKENGMVKIKLLPPMKGNPRNSEGDFVQLKDGRLLFVYTHFTGGVDDHSTAHLASRVSTDGGLTWTNDDAVVLPNEGNSNIMSVSLLRLASGEIALFYLRKNGTFDCRPVMRISTDEAKTWSAPITIIADKFVGYYVLNNDRVVQLKSGRLVVPVSRHGVPGETWTDKGTQMCFLSDDNGKTWRPSRSQLTGEKGNRPITLQEPGVVELKDGRLMMFMRTTAGCQYLSYSPDGGNTWSPAQPSDLISPCSPATIERIPKTGDLLVVWNKHRASRTPFNAAISRDEGKTWEKVKTIEDDPNGWYCYTAMEFVGDRVVLGHCAHGLVLTQITVFDVDWLYRACSHANPAPAADDVLPELSWQADTTQNLERDITVDKLLGGARTVTIQNSDGNRYSLTINKIIEHGAKTTTINVPVVMKRGARFYELNSGTVVFNGVISETGGAWSLNASPGSVHFNGLNTYTGPTVVGANSGSGNCLYINTLKLKGEPQSTGMNNLIEFAGNPGRPNHHLIYTGGTTTTDKDWQVATVGGFLNNGTGAVIWQGVQRCAGGPGARTLILGGANTDDNTWRSVIKNGFDSPTVFTHNVSVQKIGTGKWILSADNTYSGPTRVEAGALLINGNQSAGTGDVTVKDGAALGGSGRIGGAVTLESGGKLMPVAATGGVPSKLTIDSEFHYEKGTLDLSVLKSPAAGTHVLATFASRGVAEFAAVVGLPAGASLGYTDNGITLTVHKE